jgi:predicted O-methyltransferase YrrM
VKDQRWARLRAAAGDAALRVASRANRRFYVPLEYPSSSSNRPRYGYGRPQHEGLKQMFERHEPAFARELEAILEFRDDLLAIDLRPTTPGAPHWLSNWILGLDGASLYSYIRRLRPDRYVEVGSGVSTMFVARAKSDAGAATMITSIDPEPRAGIDALCDRVIRTPLEDCALTVFEELGEGDVVFIDNSHRVFMNSDVTAFYLDVLPRLDHGVLVGVHDILLPDDYLPEWSDYYWSEQYLLAAYLLADCPWIKPVLACNFASQHAELARVLDPLFSDPRMDGVDRRGFIFWFEIDRRSGASTRSV